MRTPLPRGSAHIGTWLPPDPEGGGFSLRATGSGGPRTKDAEGCRVLAIRGSPPLRKSELWQRMTPFVCQTLRFPGFQRARIANARHSSAALGSRGTQSPADQVSEAGTPVWQRTWRQAARVSARASRLLPGRGTASVDEPPSADGLPSRSGPCHSPLL